MWQKLVQAQQLSLWRNEVFVFTRQAAQVELVAVR
jgi:hypothetical protein